MTGGRERVRKDDDQVERVGWMVKSSRRYVGWKDCREMYVRDRTLKWMRSGIFNQDRSDIMMPGRSCDGPRK